VYHGRRVDDYRALNRAGWDERAPAHASSPDYGFDRFVTDQGFLSDVVRFDLPRLGDISGLRGVHLQCHIGTDTISLARLGARMSGLDFSPAAIEQAETLAARTDRDVDFHVADVYDAVEVLGEASYDLVFTGIGALCWLPSIERWAQTVAGLLRPGGRLFIREGHPMLWSLAEPRPDGVLSVDVPYFEMVEPQVWTDGGTYVDGRGVHPERLNGVEPRTRRDGDCIAECRARPHRAGGARQRPVGGLARPDDEGQRR
jgi:SAM-dependent methyltransferase